LGKKCCSFGGSGTTLECGRRGYGGGKVVERKGSLPPTKNGRKRKKRGEKEIKFQKTREKKVERPHARVPASKGAE